MILAAIGVVLLGAGALPSQQTPQGRSPVQDLLRTARTALNDLRFSDADSISSAILRLSETRRSERIQALQIRAGALYPEPEAARKEAATIEVLRQLVRLAPTAGVPREFSWTGLERLHAEVLSTTFGASALPRQENTLIGPDAVVEIDVVATRPTTFSLSLQPEPTGARVQLDTVSGTQATLRFQVLRGGVPALPTGQYRLDVLAVDRAVQDTIVVSYSAKIDAPPLTYVEVPTAPSSAPLPERTVPNKKAGIVGALVALGSSIAMSTVFRSSELKDATGSDGRAITVGIVLGTGTAAGVLLLDKGEPIPANVETNRRSRSDFELAVANARARNAELLRDYRAVVVINPEPLP